MLRAANHVAGRRIGVNEVLRAAHQIACGWIGIDEVLTAAHQLVSRRGGVDEFLGAAHFRAGSWFRVDEFLRATKLEVGVGGGRCAGGVTAGLLRGVAEAVADELLAADEEVAVRVEARGFAADVVTGGVTGGGAYVFRGAAPAGKGRTQGGGGGD